MSAETNKAMVAAIEAHVQDEVAGGIMTGFALVGSVTSVEDMEENRTQYLTAYPQDQPYHVGLGLVHQHRRLLEMFESDHD